MSNAAQASGECSSGSAGCVLFVYVQSRRGQWAEHSPLVIGWHVTRRAGKKTLLALRIRCYADPAEPCRGRYSYSRTVMVSRDGIVGGEKLER